MSALMWMPTPKQEVALQTLADFILFGGSRGGGKTDTAIQWFLESISNPKFRGLVIRRNSIDLADFVDRAFQVWAFFGARKAGHPAIFKFPSGAIIYTGHLADADSYTKYMGWELHKILIEELTHIPSRALFDKLIGSLRSTTDELRPQFMGNTNPGGAGHEWVKEYWHIGDKESGVPFEEDGVTKIFISANIDENPHLALKDPKYVRWLQSLPLDLRAKWYSGSWEDIDTENQYYSARLSRAKIDGRITSVPIESSLRTFVSMDLGVGDQMVLWYYQIFGKEVRIVDCYANRNQPIKHYAENMRDFELRYTCRVDTVYMPHDAAVRSLVSDTLQTRYEKMVELGFNCSMVDNISVDDGIDVTRDVLSSCYFDEVRCKEGIRALRAYQKEFDDKLNKYKDKPLHDWASDYADSFRYLSLSLRQSMGAAASQIMDIQKQMFRRKQR